jgi:hypothetical protein
MAESLAKVGDIVPTDTVDKAQRIAAEAVGQARGMARGVGADEWLADLEASIGKNPLLSVILAGAIGFAVAKVLR